MFECNQHFHKKVRLLIRIAALLLPVCVALLLTSQVVFAKNTYVINDGDRVVYHTTYATDPEEVLAEAGLELGEEDTYTTQDGIGVSEITIQRLQSVTVTAWGETQTVTTYETTVELLLEELGICLSEQDVLSLSLDTLTADGMTVTVDRIYTIEHTYTVSVPYSTGYVLDTTLSPDQQTVITEGVEGQIRIVDSVRYVNGVEFTRENQSSTVISEPVDRVIAVGSLEGIDPEAVLEQEADTEPSVAAGELYIGDGLIYTPEGEILTYTGTLSVKATAYHNSDPGCTIWTATGTLCRVGAIAVDPKVIPYGTRMYIVTDDGKYIYGIAVAEDCGGAIKGNRIDLYFNSVAECSAFGVRQATVYFLG